MSVVLKTIPLTPFSRMPAEVFASSEFLTIEYILGDWAIKFSSGMIVQSVVSTITFLPLFARFAAFSSSALFSIFTITKSSERFPSLSWIINLTLPSFFISFACSSFINIKSTPDSIAVVITALGTFLASRINSFI